MKNKFILNLILIAVIMLFTIPTGLFTVVSNNDSVYSAGETVREEDPSLRNEPAQYTEYSKTEKTGYYYVKDKIITGVEYKTTVSSLPLLANGTLINCSFILSGKNAYTSGNNLFSMSVNGTLSNASKDGQTLSWNPQLFIGNIEIKLVSGPKLLAEDPLDKKYHNNTIEWDYGVCVRRLRVIEGIVQDNWIFSKDPGDSVQIKENSVLSKGWSWSILPFAYDANSIPIPISDDKIVKAKDMKSANYPVTIDPTTQYVISSDASIYNQNATYNTAWTAASGSISPSSICIGQTLSTGTYTIWRYGYVYDTSTIPDDAVITAANLSIYVVNDYTTTNFNIMVTNGQPTYPHNPVVVGDYDKSYYSGLGNAGFSTAGIVTSAYNNVSLNSTGISWISLTGETKLLVRSDREIAGTVPVGSEYMSVTSNYLEVTYTSLTSTVTYTSAGTVNWTVPARVSSVKVLVVAGGGGGGGAFGAVFNNRRAGGGGGAGGYQYNTSYPVVAGTNVSVTVGAGGAGGLYNVNGAAGYNGSNSKFGTINATGGGGGGGAPQVATDADLQGRNGGSGGGEGALAGADGASAGTGSQGYNGGLNFRDGTETHTASGGGGGAGSKGTNASSATKGVGGSGVANTISGPSVTYATGGDGGAVGSAVTGATGAANTGNGGGGAVSSSILSYAGGAGGSGVVIIEYTQAPLAPTDVVATDGTYTSKVTVTWTKSYGATGYYVYNGSTVIATLGDVATYDDTGASAPTITGGAANASDGLFTAYVNLSIIGQSGNNGSSRTYKVVGFNAGGNSSDSNTDTGYRGTTTLTYQWLRSAGVGDALYSAIAGGTTTPYNDTGAPADGSTRFFKCTISMTDATSVNTSPNQGYRARVYLTTSSSSGGNVTTPGEIGSPYVYNSSELVTIVGTADACYRFLNWTGSTANITDVNAASTTINMSTSNQTATANFVINTSTITYSANAGGTIVGSTPQTINCGNRTTAVTATPNSCYRFTTWSDANVSATRTDLGTSTNQTFTATFVINTSTITYSAGANGTLNNSTPQTINCGTNTTYVLATGNACYHFTTWNDSSTMNPRTDVGTSTNKSFTANFAINVQTVTYSAGSGGTVNGSWPENVNCGSNSSWVLATANSCYHFVNWSDSSTTNPRRELNVTSNLSYTANFAVDIKTVTYAAGANGTVNGSWPENVNCGSNSSWVLATGNSCYHFVNWSDSSTTNPRRETNVTSNLSFTANFAIDIKTVTYSAGTGGSVNGSWPESINCGSNGSWVLATANNCYHFVNWNDSSTTNPRHETNVTSNLSFTANFAVNSPPSDAYWVGGSGNWSDATNHWASSSNGTQGACNLPAISTNAHFDENSFTAGSNKVTIDTDFLECNDMDWTGSTNNPELTWSIDMWLDVYGNVTFVNGMTVTNSVPSSTGQASIEFAGDGDLTSNGVTIGVSILIYGEGSSLSLQDDLVMSGNVNESVLTIGQSTNSSFYTNDNDATITVLYADFLDSNYTIDFGSSTVNITSSYANLNFMMGVSGTVSANDSTIIISSDGKFDGGDFSYGNVEFVGNNHLIYGNNTYGYFDLASDVSQDIVFESGSTQTMSTVSLNGSSGHMHNLSSEDTTTVTFEKSGGGTVSSDYIYILYVDASPSDTWCYGTHSTEGDGCSGWSACGGELVLAISNSPDLKAFSTVLENSDYWSNGSEPSFPLNDSQCYFTVTNDGDTVSIFINATAFTGGVGWALNNSAGEDIVVLKAGISGDANETDMVTLNGSDQSFISGLAASDTMKWEIKLETGTFTDGATKTGYITLTGVLD